MPKNWRNGCQQFQHMPPSELPPSPGIGDFLKFAAEFDDTCRIVENSIDRLNEEWRLRFSNGYCLCLRGAGTFDIRRI